MHMTVLEPRWLLRKIQLPWVAALVGCAEASPAPTGPPTLEDVTATAGVSNALSARVFARVGLADSLVVRYGPSGHPRDSVTPPLTPKDGAVVVPVLGLRASTSYALELIAYGEGGTAASEVLQISTGALPTDLPAYRAGGPSPSPGYVAFSAGRYGVVIDNAGQVVWYVHFEEGPSLNFQAEANGRYVARPLTEDPRSIEPLLEIDPLGTVTRRLSCARGLRPRFHDVLVRPDGSYWVMCDDTRAMNLSDVGGDSAAQVTGTVVQRISESGDLEFEWSPFDHFEITDADAETRSGPTVNWTHGNAIDLDADGNLLVSFRSLSEITKIDTRTGEVLWRMGGLRNEFRFTQATPPFLRQHGARMTPAGDVILLDNLGEPAGSRAERYTLDESSRTARLTGVYAPPLAIRAMLGGTTQNLPGGRTLVAFGDGGGLEEFDAEGNVVWAVEGNAGYVFRAQRIHSLYDPGKGLTR
jgi:Arylsulfotransferase (ASST)